jgi:hypothetical protein
VHARLPFFSKVERYKQYATIQFQEGADENDMTSSEAPIEVRFADTYTGQIPASFRVRLPEDCAKLLDVHRSFRTFNNLVSTMYVKTTRDVVINTATQYTGEEFFQGGLNQFKNALADQMEKGVYATERRRVEVEEAGLAAIGIDQRDPTKVEKKTQLVWKTVPVVDEKGNFVRIENPLAAFGITVDQITIGNPTPEPTLEKLLTDKKTLVAQRIKTVQEQETAKEEARTEQIKKDIERTKETQEALKRKDLAVIAEQQKVEVEQKKAETEKVQKLKEAALALIEKQKEIDLALAEKKKAEAEKSRELAVSTANLEIERANFEASKFAALAIKEKGLAEAAVRKASYEALKPDIYLAEIHRDIARVFYPNLKDFKVVMPQTMISGGGEGSVNSLDLLTKLTAIGVTNALNKAEPAKP